MFDKYRRTEVFLKNTVVLFFEAEKNKKRWNVEAGIAVNVKYLRGRALLPRLILSTHLLISR